MHRFISIENISFSRNCDIKTTKCEESHRCFYLGKAYSRNSYTVEIEHSLLNSPIIISCYGLYFRSTDFADKHWVPGQFLKKIIFCDRALLSHHIDFCIFT